MLFCSLAKVYTPNQLGLMWLWKLPFVYLKCARCQKNEQDGENTTAMLLKIFLASAEIHISEFLAPAAVLFQWLSQASAAPTHHAYFGVRALRHIDVQNVPCPSTTFQLYQRPGITRLSAERSDSH